MSLYVFEQDIRRKSYAEGRAEVKEYLNIATPFAPDYDMGKIIDSVREQVNYTSEVE